MKKNHGFTLIELMIVVAIIAILAAIALPAYQDYTIRSQVSEGSVLADGAKTAVAEYFVNKGVWPTNNTSAGLAASGSIIGKFVNGLTVATGKITTTFASAAPYRANSAINGKSLIFSPTATAQTAGSIGWRCTGGGGIQQKHLPLICRTNEN